MLLRRRVAALMVVALVSTLSTAAKGQSGGSLRRLTEALLRKSVTQASDGIIPAELVARQFIPPLWSTTDRDVIPSVGKHIGRSPKQAQGDELSNGAADPDPDPHPNPTRRTLRNDDFVYTAPCTPQRLPLAQASRYWRKGMRAVFVMDEPTGNLPKEVTASANKYRESYAWFPNFRRMANDKRDHYLEGDRRAAMTPVLAYAALADPAAMTPWTQLPSGPRSSAAKPTQMASDPSPTPTGAAASSGNGSSADPFQWLLVGDDDTIFFMRGVKALLRDYDPQLPYFLSDSMYVGSKSPQPGVWEMRCYPCHMQWGRWRRRAGRRLMATADGGREVQQAKGCGCSTENLCKRRFPGNETRCQQEWEGPVPWGGVGFIFSIGFFKQLAASQGGTGLRAYETCINAPETSVMSFPEGGDAFMSRCFWRLGFPITDPGYTPLGRYMGEVLHLGHLYDAPANLTRGQLPPQAMERWSTAVSMHLGARQQRSFRSAALTIKYISSVYDLVGELLWPTGRRADA